MRMYDIIDKKRDGGRLTRQEIQFFVKGYTEGSIPDYQASALLMAICLKGMDDDETFALTQAMTDSGKKVDLSSINLAKLDKHSTGGVGDKTSLVLVPLLVAAQRDIAVPKASGRGLGHTGGTLDKLESIPGYRVTLSDEEFFKQISGIRMAIVGQSDEIAPADRKLYALRDATATVQSIPLIASSIMSKKLADGSDIQLLDVKYGNGAFMETKEDAEKLAKVMIQIGTKAKKTTWAEITSMNQPLGFEIGNSNEVIEAINTLKGQGPTDLTELCLESGATLLIMAGKSTSRDNAKYTLRQAIQDGSAFEMFRTMVSRQGGDVSYIDDVTKFPKARYNVEVKALSKGVVHAINTKDLGIQSMKLGAGRSVKEDIIDHAAGITLKKKIGDKVNEEEVIAVLHSERPNISEIARAVAADFTIHEGEAEPDRLIEELLTPEDTY